MGLGQNSGGTIKRKGGRQALIVKAIQRLGQSGKAGRNLYAGGTNGINKHLINYVSINQERTP